MTDIDFAQLRNLKMLSNMETLENPLEVFIARQLMEASDRWLGTN